MADFFKFLKPVLHPSYLGIDIGTTSIKIIEVNQGKQLPNIVNYGILETDSYLTRVNSALQTSSLKLFEREVVELLKVLLAKMKPKTNEVLASLPLFSSFVTVLDFPKMPDSDLSKAVIYQAQQYIPSPISEVAIDWIKVGEYSDEKGVPHMQILLTSVPKEQIQKYQNIFKAAGLNLRLLEIETLSLGRVLIGSDPTPTLVVDIGARSTNIAFFEKAHLKFNVQSDLGGSVVTQALVNSLKINPIRAEELKRNKGISGTGPDYELSTLMLPYVDAIIGEVKKAQYNYKIQQPSAAAVERIVLAGGGSNLSGLEAYLKKQFGIPTVMRANPFVKFEYDTNIIEPIIGELGPIMCVPLGLTLREFI
ncbi:MAG: type IV pilus assembly protein PilM [Patescibacteria group bacterium]|nr:type IV pilus assembly protein PilM [Patescibacteria group bacterium]